jgi:phenylalanyl-tRNA synthetase beta chain
MKISLAWISEYFKDKSLASVSPEEIQSRFNQVTAEIEYFDVVEYPINQLALAQVTAVKDDEIALMIDEWNQSIVLPPKATRSIVIGERHLVFKDAAGIRFATARDLLSEKEFELPPFFIPESEKDGSWKKRIDQKDIVFDVDNKSITNRPDLWGHYGCAREIAAFLKKEIIPYEEVSRSIQEQLYDHEGTFQVVPLTIKNQALDRCLVYAAVYVPEAAYQASEIAMAFRLIRVGSKPIHAMVDITNYVLYDLGQPMHAYNADEIVGDLVIRQAKDQESVALLSDLQAIVTSEDLIIADQKKVLCLAGIKGAAHGSMDIKKHSVLLEAATFHAATIRRSALRHKLRTDSSARFEKTLDEKRTISALKRFLFLAQQQGLINQKEYEAVIVGKIPEPHVITVGHAFLRSRSGIDLIESDVVRPLEAMGFAINILHENEDVVYQITVPSFRASKDVRIKEDILEEVVRHYGFDRIPVLLPPLTKQPKSLDAVLKTRLIKRYLAYTSAMIEQINYAYIDDQILQRLGWVFENPVQMINPVAENQKTMVQSLLPALCNNLIENMHEADQLRFFELGRTMKLAEESIVETKKIAGIFFNKRADVDFYQGKAVLEGLFNLCSMKKVEWRQVTEKREVWMRPYRTAELWVDGVMFGYAGMMNNEMLYALGGIEESSAFCFELLYEPLLVSRETTRLAPLSKYQGSSFDFALMVPRDQTVASLESMILELSDQIVDVQLFDFYEKKEWKDIRSVGIRIWVQSHEQTLTKEMIDAVRTMILNALAARSVTLRA